MSKPAVFPIFMVAYLLGAAPLALPSPLGPEFVFHTPEISDNPCEKALSSLVAPWTGSNPVTIHVGTMDTLDLTLSSANLDDDLLETLLNALESARYAVHQAEYESQLNHSSYLKPIFQRIDRTTDYKQGKPLIICATDGECPHPGRTGFGNAYFPQEMRYVSFDPTQNFRADESYNFYTSDARIRKLVTVSTSVTSKTALIHDFIKGLASYHYYSLMDEWRAANKRRIEAGNAPDRLFARIAKLEAGTIFLDAGFDRLLSSWFDEVAYFEFQQIFSQTSEYEASEWLRQTLRSKFDRLASEPRTSWAVSHFDLNSANYHLHAEQWLRVIQETVKEGKGPQSSDLGEIVVTE